MFEYDGFVSKTFTFKEKCPEFYAPIAVKYFDGGVWVNAVVVNYELHTPVEADSPEYGFEETPLHAFIKDYPQAEWFYLQPINEIKAVKDE